MPVCPPAVGHVRRGRENEEKVEGVVPFLVTARIASSVNRCTPCSLVSEDIFPAESQLCSVPFAMPNFFAAWLTV